MKIPLNWLIDYVKTGKSAKNIARSFTQLGLLLDKPIEKTLGTEVLDLEHRMDRSDWLSIIGCARDLAAFEGLELEYPKSHKEAGKEGGGVKIEIKCPELVNRFNTRVFRNIKVKSSPDWLKQRLEAYGIPAINNIVDITNFVMVEYGQTMHAQDLAKMKTPEIVIRRAKDGEEITTLLGERLKLDSEMFVLTQNDIATVIGGIVGGVETAVDETTKDMVLDAGNYNQNNIRKTSRKLKILNESVLRNDKFLHPHSTQVAIERATHLILALAGGEYYENYDWYPHKWPLKKMTLRLKRLEQVSGMQFNIQDVTKTLEALEYKILDKNESAIYVEIPYFRTDVEVEDDLAADVLRIKDYTNIPIAPIESAPPKEITPKIYKFEEMLKTEMVKLGTHEHITDPLVACDENSHTQVKLQNALTTEKSALRQNIYGGLKKVAEIYKKHKKANIALFEIGKIYEMTGKSNNLANFTETRVLETVFATTEKSPYELSKVTKTTLSGLLHNLGIENIKYEIQNNENNETRLYQNKLLLGVVEIDYFRLLTENLLKAQRHVKRAKHQIPQIISENLSIILDEEQPFGSILYEIHHFDALILNAEVIEEYIDEQKIGKSKKSILVKVDFDGKHSEMTKIAKTKENLIKVLMLHYPITLKTSDF